MMYINKGILKDFLLFMIAIFFLAVIDKLI